MAKTNRYVKDVETDKIFADFNRNVRLRSRMDCSDKSGLWIDMWNNGFRVDKPLTVSLQPDGLFKVVQGHRRFLVATEINKRSPGRIPTIPCLVFEGLTDHEELEMLIDQAHIQNLNDFEQYLSVKRLVLAGLSEEAIARHIGKSRGFVQRRKQIARLPEVVAKAYQAKYEQVEDKSKVGYFPNLTDKNLQDLDQAANADSKAKIDPESEGSQFMTVWSKFMAGDPTGPKPKVKTLKDLDDGAKMVKEPLVTQVLNWCKGDGDLDHVAEDIKSLRNMANEAVDLKKEVEVKTVQMENLTTDRDANVAKVVELTTTIETMTAQHEAEIKKLHDVITGLREEIKVLKAAAKTNRR